MTNIIFQYYVVSGYGHLCLMPLSIFLRTSTFTLVTHAEKKPVISNMNLFCFNSTLS